MIVPRETVRAAVDEALSDDPQVSLMEAIETAAMRLALPVEAVLEAVAVEEAMQPC